MELKLLNSGFSVDIQEALVDNLICRFQDGHPRKCSL